MLDLTMGYYSRADMTLLAKVLTDKGSGAALSRKVRDIAETRLTWYLV